MWFAFVAVLLQLFVPIDSGILRTNTDNFTFESYHADYVLSRDDDGRATLTTTETLVAVFPDHDQNRGLQRAIPTHYALGDTELTVLSVTDEHGNPRDMSTWVEGDFMIVQSAVPEGEYEHGRTTYVIEYEQIDVALINRNDNEFYWDLNGTGWRQPFGTVSATLTLEDGLRDAFNGNAACYRGAEGSTDTCMVEATSTGFQVSESGIGGYENVTIAIGFQPGTFQEKPVPWLVQTPVIAWIGGLTSLGGIGVWIGNLIRNARGKRTGDPIIAQYEPPAGVSLATSANLTSNQHKVPAATLMDLAVRGNIRVLHKDGHFGAQYLHDRGLLPEEKTFVNDLFKGKPTTDPQGGLSGRYLWFDSKDYTFGDAAVKLTNTANNLTTAQGLRTSPKMLPIFLPIMLFGAGVLIMWLYFTLADNDLGVGTTIAIGGFLAMFIGIFSFVTQLLQRPTTLQGAKLRDHLEGLREYIRLAEADRLRMLQSVSGAEVTEKFVVKVYERLLPYAIMFGLEKEWQSELAKFYATTPPEWAAGDTSTFLTLNGFNALNRSVAVSRPTPSTSSSSGGWGGSGGFSSSGGSSGGGFSGGGGGGGGGRGI